MKKLWLVIGIVALYGAYPYWAANSLAEALEDGDEATLRRAVDWQAVRAGLKEDLAGALSREAGKAIVSGEPGAAAGGVLASTLGRIMLDPVIDALVTPQSLATMIRQGRAHPGSPETGPSATRGEGETVAQDLRERVSWAFFSGPAAFDVVLEDDEGREVVAELQLQGLRWRLVRLRFPDVP